LADESSVLRHYPYPPILTRLVSVLVSASMPTAGRVNSALVGFCVLS
jgi:hypothetical protein